MKNVLIVGATSAIASATAQLLAARTDGLYLVARNREKLEAVAGDLSARGAGKVQICVMDALEYDRHPRIFAEAEAALGGLDTLLIAHGTLPNQERCQESFELTMREIEINLLGTISLLTHAANYFEQKRSGEIVVITSVAGERGRQSNYVYGAAKGGVSLFLQGLRNRLDKSGVNVLDIKPGFVDTPMTADFPNKGILWSQPHRIARHIIRAIDRRQDIAYVPWFWCFIMMAIRTIPERLFKKLKL